MPKSSVFGEVEVTKLLMQPPAGTNTVNGKAGNMLTDADLHEIVQKGDGWWLYVKKRVLDDEGEDMELEEHPTLGVGSGM
jgi:hypothetical protein